MSTNYSKDAVKKILEEARQTQAETVDLYTDVIYNAEMWAMKQKLKDVTSAIKTLEGLYESLKPEYSLTAEQGDRLEAALKVIKKCNTKMKKYHKAQAEQDYLTVADNNSDAFDLFKEIESNWRPEIEKAVSAKEWETAAKLLLEMPYRKDLYATMLFNREITDKSIVEYAKITDKFIAGVCAKIPQKTFETAVRDFYQAKIDTLRASGARTGAIISEKFSEDNNFSIDDLPQHTFLLEEKRALEDRLYDINRVSLEYDSFLQLGVRSRNKERD